MMMLRNSPASLGQIPATSEPSYPMKRATWYNLATALAAVGGATAAFGSLKKSNSLVSNIGLGALGAGLAGLGFITLIYNAGHLEYAGRNPHSTFRRYKDW